jgi:4-hydroxybenzoate polyprenyltransferase
MKALWALARCSHPEPVVAVTSVCGVLALLAGRGAWGVVWVMLAVAAGQLFVGWTNDYLDRRRDSQAQRPDKPLARGEISARPVAIAAAIAGLALVPLSLASGVPATIVHVIGVVSATAYNLGLKATWLSVLPYAVSFAMVPAFITLGLAHPHWPPVWVTAATSLTGVGGHFAQARPDVARDRRQHVLGLPQLVGDRGSAIAAALFLVAGAAAIAYGARNPLPLVVVLPAIGVAVLPPVAAFRFTLVTAGVTVVAFVVIAGSALR